MDVTSTDEDLPGFVRRAEEAADAWVCGDMGRYLDLVQHASGFTLLAPTGGPATRHEDRHAELAGWASPFAEGEARLEDVETHAWGDAIVLVMTERQHGRVGDQPDQDLSVRVTHVYRRDASGWLLVHRHADPLTAPVPLENVMALLRG